MNPLSLDKLLNKLKLNSRHSLVNKDRRVSIKFWLVVLGVLVTSCSVLPDSDLEIRDTGNRQPVINCLDNSKDALLKIAITDFQGEGFFSERENDIYHYLLKEIGDIVLVCRTYKAIKSSDEAIREGNRLSATLFVWGKNDGIESTVYIDALTEDVDGVEFFSIPLQETSEVRFKFKEQDQLKFLTGFIASEVLSISGEQHQAKQLLEKLLEDSKGTDLEKINGESFAQAYFLLGTLFENSKRPGSATDNTDLEQAILAYSTSFKLDPYLYLTVLNRARLYTQLDQVKEAFQDYSYLISNNTPLAAEALVSRANLRSSRIEAEGDFKKAIELDPSLGYQFRGNKRLIEWDDPKGASEDFQAAIELNVDNPLLHHFLALSQIELGQMNKAEETYETVLPYLSTQNYHFFISDLEYAEKTFPHLSDQIREIIANMEENTVNNYE